MWKEFLLVLYLARSGSTSAIRMEDEDYVTEDVYDATEPSAFEGEMVKREVPQNEDYATDMYDATESSAGDISKRVVHLMTTKMPWIQGIITEDGMIPLPGLPNTPPEFSRTFFHPICFGKPDTTFESCITSDNEEGHYRYVQYCLSEKLSSYYYLISNLRIIDERCVGVCCPEPKTNPSPHDAIGCGQIPTGRMEGDHEDTQKWPWLAALIQPRLTVPTHFCAGALISSKDILTAAHCVDRLRPSDLVVRLGDYRFEALNDGFHHDYSVASIKIHNAYNDFNFANDIAIVTLHHTVAFSSSVLPICLPPQDDFVDENATVVGWGTIYYGGPVSEKLKVVDIPVWSNAECDEAYGNPIFEQFLCAGGREEGVDSCEGDGGAPLMLKIGTRGRWSVIGLVSWGISCAQVDKPGVYTRVSHYIQWINENSGL